MQVMFNSELYPCYPISVTSSIGPTLSVSSVVYVEVMPDTNLYVFSLFLLSLALRQLA